MAITEKAKDESLAKWARDKFADELRNSGLYSSVSEKSRSYADVEAIRYDGSIVYFEIKATAITKEELRKRIDNREKYFGAATLTEWKTAIRNPDNYIFVLLCTDIIDGQRVIIDKEEFSPKELLEFSTVPPFKVIFNVPYKKAHYRKKTSHRPSTVKAIDNKGGYSVIERLIKFFISIGGDL